jgi:non-specific serine/threonine protein kinase
MPSFTLTLTPRGRLLFTGTDDASQLTADRSRTIEAAFARGSGHGLLALGAGEVGTALPADVSYWRDFAAEFVTALCTRPDTPDTPELASISLPPHEELEALAAAAPPMTGAEYVTASGLETLWTEIAEAFRAELAESKASVQEFLRRKNPAWHLVGRVHFNLAENRMDTEAPFAFLATYTTQLSTQAANAQHLPLGRALGEYAGAANTSRLLSLLLPVQRAAAECPWLKRMVDAGEIYHPLRWTPAEAFQLLQDVPRLEAAGVIVRVPTAWRSNRPPRPQATGTVGGKPPSGLGKDALLDFKMGVSLDGEPLTEAEIETLLAASNGLHLVRGRWVEVDREKLARMLEEFRSVEAAAAKGGLSFGEAMRLVAGAHVPGDVVADTSPDWSAVVAGPWLKKTLAGLRDPDQLAQLDPGAALRTTLRPYQQAGVRWLHLLSSLGLGACLADDMGLGKTMQVLALLLVLKRKGENDPGREHDPGGRFSRSASRKRESTPGVSASRERESTPGVVFASAPRPSLLVAPASLLANWAAEIERFAPSLTAIVAHPSTMPPPDLKTLTRDRIAGVDLVITSYGSLLRVPALIDTAWRLAILDEAQAIKTPGAKQTRAAKQINAQARIALSGTPVENRLGDLWSIFDFLNPGLLGSGKAFSTFTKHLSSEPHNPYGPLRALVRPYILRRLKTDKSVIADLPDKTEVKAFCQLTRKQAALYQQSVTDLASALEQADGMKRRGVVLASLMRLRQICNHPSQWLGDGSWREADSGKLARLREIAEVIAARQEKVLAFTQFREMTGPLAAFLGSVFGRPGLVLHGETPVRTRQSLVTAFQEDERVPFFVLSLKAGGAGLNLTAASHVVHFDRWWNPAVENQATDRAFRIGQTKNVLVHKFVCRGTVEEKIDQLIDSKRQLSQESRTLQRLRESAAARPDLRAQWIGGRSAGGAGTRHGARQRVEDVRREGDGHAGGAGALRRSLQGVLGRDRLPCRTAAGTLLEGRDDAPLRGEDGVVPVTERHHLHVQLSGLGVDVQARGRRVVRHRRAARSSAGVALHAPQGRSPGVDYEGRGRSVEAAQGACEIEGARERRPLGCVRHRDGAGHTAETEEAST